jgi:hypothetical protein
MGKMRNAYKILVKKRGKGSDPSEVFSIDGWVT